MTDTLDKRARNAALEALREEKFNDLKKIYERQFAIATSLDVEPKDATNAAKVCSTILGVARPVEAKPPAAPPAKPTAAQQVAPLRQELLDAIDKKIGGK